jgi:hypothetical protein
MDHPIGRGLEANGRREGNRTALTRTEDYAARREDARAPATDLPEPQARRPSLMARRSSDGATVLS